MKKVKIDSLVKAVRVKLDEIGENDSEFVIDKDENELDTIIKSCFDEAVKYAFTNADTNLIEANHEQTFEYDEGGEEGEFYVPTLYLEVGGSVVGQSIAGELYRLVFGKLDCWTRAVDKPILWTDKEYSRLSNPLTTGTPERPEIGISTGKHSVTKARRYAFEFYSAEKSSGSGELSLLVHPKANTLGEYEIPDRLESALVWHMAGQTLTILHDNHAEAMFQQALLAMGRQDKLSGQPQQA